MADEIPLTPDARAKPGAKGTEVGIGGMTWLLCGHVPAFEPIWDKIYDHNVLAGRYEEFDIHAAAIRLLWVNYLLTPEEAADLIHAADPEELVHAVEVALFGGEKDYHGYGEYVRVSFWANGIDPATMPGEMVIPVLDYLVEIKRAIPPAAFISSLQAAAVRKSFAALIKPKPVTPEPTPPELPTNEPE